MAISFLFEPDVLDTVPDNKLDITSARSAVYQPTLSL